MVNDGRVNLAFTNATRNDLGVLRAKIKNDNLFVHRFERGGFKPRFRRLCETKNLAKRFSLAQEERKASVIFGCYTNSGINLPCRTIITGRPVGVRYSLVWSIPNV